MLKFLDQLGALLAMGSTLFSLRVNLLTWPLGILSVFVNAYLYYIKGIYADFCLEILYFLMMVYGWYYWLQGNNLPGKAVTDISKKQLFTISCCLIIGSPLVAMFLKHQMHSQIPWLDATTALFSITAQWLMCKKVIQSWICWFISDALFIQLYKIKGLPYHAGLFTIYLGVAMLGYWQWHRIRQKSNERLANCPA